MNYTDEQLKRALAKVTPELAVFVCGDLMWLHYTKEFSARKILDSELLHLCWLVEQEFDGIRLAYDYSVELRFVIEPNHGFVGDYRYINATWQQKVIALAAIKKVEIV